MKTIYSILISASFILTAIAGYAQSEKTEIRNVSGFSSVKVSSGIDLFLTMGNNESVKVVADNDIIDEIKTDVVDGTLKIYVKSGSWFNWNWKKTRKVYVEVKTIESLDASAGSDVISENLLKGDKLSVAASSGSDVKLQVAYDEVTVDASSGSDAELEGQCRLLRIDSSSGSDVDANGLKSEICHASVSSGADAVVNVSNELEANASSGGDINYLGNPTVKNINESSGGDVSKK